MAAKCSEKNDSRKTYEYFCKLTPTERENEYRKIAYEVFNYARDIYYSTDGWKLATGKNDETGSVHYKRIPELGKIFKLRGIIDLAPADFFRFVQEDMEKMPIWNPTVSEATYIAKMGDVDITYYIAKGIGPISSRDFINLRHWRQENGRYLLLCKSTEHIDYPENGHSKHVRGYNKPGGWVIEAVPNEPNRCVLVWIASTDLRGWMPQVVIDQYFPKFLMEYLSNIRRYMKNVYAK